MSDYSSTYPTQSPVFAFDAKAGKLDSRISFSRADTPPTYAAPSAVHYWSNQKHLSSENLFDKSNVYNSGGWLEVRVDQTIGQTDPSGGTAAKLITQASGQTNAGVIYYTSTFGSDELTFSIYLKPNGRTKPNLSENLTDSSNAVKRTYFDLTGSGAVGTKDAAHTASIAKFGDYYRCTITFTPHAADSGSVYLYISDTDNSQTVADDGNGYIVYGANLSTTGQLVTNETSGSIHRSFAPTLKSVANAGDPRFEYDPTDGQSDGLLIESQSSNLATYGSDLTNAAWNPLSAFIGGTAVGPDGTLSAVKLVASSGSGFYPRFRRLSLLTDTTQTFSIYVKPLEFQHLAISADGSTSSLVQYNLSGNGAITSQTGATGSVEQCGNGWFRVSFSYTTVPNAHLAITMQSSTTYQTETGNGYDGMLFALAQLENQSSSSSYISTTSSTATRAADSCSVVSAPLLDNGSGGLTVEYDMRNASATSYVLQTARSTGGTTQDGATIFQEGLLILGQGSNTRIGSTTSNVFHTVAASWESGSQKISRDGSAVAEDTTTVVPQSGTDKLHIGTRQDGNASLNGHIRNIAIYSEPLTSTNLTALSQL